MFTDTVRLSKQGRDKLITLKRKTGIENWNVLCRWAFCVSVADESRPLDQKIVTDSSIEMTWHTFAGDNEEIYEAVLRDRCKRDGLPLTDECLLQQFRLHLHRGINYLAGDSGVKNLVTMVRKAVPLAAE